MQNTNPLPDDGSEYVTITSRTRNLGFGCTSIPVRRLTDDGQSHLTIREPSAPGVVGSLGQVEREIQSARRTNSGNDWRGGFWVGGRRITGVWEWCEEGDSDECSDGRGRYAWCKPRLSLPDQIRDADAAGLIVRVEED